MVVTPTSPKIIHATFPDDMSRQREKQTSRAVVHALLLIAVLCRQYREGRYLVLRTENGANLLAQSALRANTLVYLGIEKFLAILT